MGKLFWIGIALVIVGFWLFVPITLFAVMGWLGFRCTALLYFLAAVLVTVGWLTVELVESGRKQKY